jgi:hypothetical protein
MIKPTHKNNMGKEIEPIVSDSRFALNSNCSKSASIDHLVKN